MSVDEKPNVWERIREPISGIGTAKVTVRDCLLVTYAIPVERIRSLVPETLTLDLLPGADGEPVAFLQTVSLYAENARPIPLPTATSFSFYEVLHRVLVRQEGKRGAYLLQARVSTSEAHNAQRGFIKACDYARFQVHVAGNPVPGRRQYESYTVRASNASGQTTLEARFANTTPEAVPPFGRFDDMSHFLTAREEWFFDAVLPLKSVSQFTVTQEPFNPLAGELTTARISYWTESGILTPEETEKPLCVLLQPSAEITLRPPKTVKPNK